MKNRPYILLYMILLWQSCTQVQLCYEDSHPHTTSLTFDFDWKGYEDEKPEQMYVLLNRIINTKHYVFPVDISQSIVSDKESPDSPSTYQIEGGEYAILALNINESYMNSQKIEEFAKSTSVYLSDIEIALTTYDTSGLEEMEQESWIDFNPTYKYIKAPDVVFIGTENQDLYHGIEKTVHIKPARLSQTIKIRFGLLPDPTIKIQKVVGEISGTIGKVKVLSLEVNDSDTYRMSFYPQQVAINNGITMYEGVINSFGLLPNINYKEMTGPGILHLAIYIERKDGGTRVYHERINLINTITNSNSTLVPEGTEKSRKLNPDIKEIKLEINSYLIIGLDKVSSDNTGVDKWEIGENYIDTEG